MTNTFKTASASEDIALSRHLRGVAISAGLAVQSQLIAAFRSTMEIDFKKDWRDIVTVHDKAAEEVIAAHLLTAVPASEVVGEEGGTRGSGPVRWFVDPIDGTANFARGLPNWCVSIGAVKHKEIIAAAIVDPMGGNIFSADLTGAWLGERPMRSEAAKTEKFATLISSYPAARDFDADGRTEALETFGILVESFSSVRRNGSAALGLAHVAAGWADCAAGFGINPWDVTAAILILRQAGGRYKPLHYGPSPAPAPDHYGPAYCATGAGAQYTGLSSLTSAIAARRPS